MIDVLSIIILIFSILQIILFFKVCVMTNNVNAIKSCIVQKQTVEDLLIREAQILTLKGEIEEARLRYFRAFYLSVIELYEKAQKEYETQEDMKNEFYENKYKNIVRYFEERLSKIGGTLDKEKFDSFKKVNTLISPI